MRAGLTRQALRGHPWSFFGPVVTLCLGAAIVSGALGAQQSFATAPLDAAGRRALEATDAAEFAALFVGIAVYLSVIIVGLTMASTIARQARDIALVRAVGATPGRVRRAVATQAAVVAVPAVLVGVPLGTLAGRAWVAGMADHGVIPAAVAFRPSAAAWPAALAIAVGSAVVGALIAAIRPARVRPAVALAETAVPRRTFGRVRTGLGLVLVVGGVVLSAAITTLPADQADDLGFFVVLAMCVGSGLLGPALLRITAPLVRLLGAAGVLAADNVTVRAKALSGALVPLVLAAGFAAIKVAVHTTSAHVNGTPDPAADVWLENSGTAVYATFAAVAALNTLVTVMLSRRGEIAATRLAGATRGRVLGVVACEALIVTGTGLLAAAGVAIATLTPLLHTALDTWTPYLPPSYLAAGVLTVAGLVGLGTVLPAALLTRQPAIAAVEVDP
jgi:putative ABC transport system permease protein